MFYLYNETFSEFDDTEFSTYAEATIELNKRNQCFGGVWVIRGQQDFNRWVADNPNKPFGRF